MADLMNTDVSQEFTQATEQAPAETAPASTPSFGYDPSTAEPVQYGYAPAPKPTPATPTDIADSLSRQYAIVTGEHADTIREEFQSAGTHPAKDRAYNSAIAAQSDTSTALADRAAATGDVDAAAAHAAHLSDLQLQLLEATAADVQKEKDIAGHALTAVAAEDANKNFPTPTVAAITVENQANARAQFVDIQRGFAEHKAKHEIKYDTTPSGLWNVATGVFNVATDLVGGGTYAEARFQKLMHEQTGVPYSAFPDEFRHNLATVWLGLGHDRREEILNMLDTVGMTKQALHEYYDKMEEEMSRLGSIGQLVMSGADLLMVGDVAKLIARRGVAAAAVRGVNPRAAGEAVAEDLTKGTAASDLKGTEQVAAASSVVDHETFLVPGSTEGLSSHITTPLKQNAKETWQKLDTLKGAGRTEEEIQAGKAEVESRYNPATREDLHSATFGEAKTNDVEVVANWKRADGSLYPTVEEALAVAQRDGMSNIKILPVAEAEVKPVQIKPDTFSAGSDMQSRLLQAYKDRSASIIEQAKTASVADKKEMIAQLDELTKVIKMPESPEKLLEAERLGLISGAKEKIASEAVRLEQQKAVLAEYRPQFANKRMVLGKDVDPLFGDAIKGVMKELGLGNEKVLIGHFSELSSLNRDIGDMSGNAVGAYLRPEPGRPFHVLAMNDVIGPLKGENQVARLRGMTTLVHESNHLFYHVVLRSDQYKPVRTAIKRAFLADFEKGKINGEAMFARMRQAPQLMEEMGDSASYSLQNLKKAVASPHFLDWLTHEEWFVEQMSKAMFNDPRTLTHLQKPFGQLVDKLKSLYKFIATKLGFDASQAHELVQGFLRKHLDDVKAGKFKSDGYGGYTAHGQQLTYNEVDDVVKATRDLKLQATEGLDNVTLPTELRGAQPRYGQAIIHFMSDLDKAAYIVAQAKRSKSDAKYLDFVMKATGKTEEEARAFGQEVKQRVAQQIDQTGNGAIGASDTAMQAEAGIRAQAKAPAEMPSGVVPTAEPASGMVPSVDGEPPSVFTGIKPVAPSHTPGGYVIQQKLTVPYRRSTIGGFDTRDMESMGIPGDPKHGASKFAVEERVIAVHAEDKMRAALVDHIKQAWNPLSKGERTRVINVLEEGNAYGRLDGGVGKEFSGTDLLTMGLNEKEINAYYAVRQVRNMTHNLRDSELVRELASSGHMDLAFSVIEEGVGRRISIPAMQVDKQAVVGKYIWDATTNQGVKITQEIADSLPLNVTIHKMRETQDIAGKTFEHVMVTPRSGRTTEITTVLPYRPGEYSRIYTDEYFVKAMKHGQVDGVQRLSESVVRTAQTQTEADAYAKSLNDAIDYMQRVASGAVATHNPEIEVGRLLGTHTDPAQFVKDFQQGKYEGMSFGTKYNRTREEYLNDFTGMTLAERPFTGQRGPAVLAIDPTRRNTLDIMRSLESEITNVSRVANVGAWRENMIQRWMNQFGHLITDRTGNDVADFYKMEGKTFSRRSDEAVFAERTHDYILKQLGLKTDEEKRYANWVRRVTEAYPSIFDTKVGIETVGAKIRKASLLNFVRSLNFNLTLGMFNPAQVLVQANGMMTAMAISPLHGLAAAKTFPLLRMALMSDNPEVHAFFGGLNKLSDLGMSSVDEFKQLIAAVHKTGIISNLRSTALHNLEDGKLGITSGLGGKIAAAGRMPFNRGEEASRLVSFDIARREFMKANPGVDWMSDAALKRILVRTDDFTQNMTRANQAAWQKGITSIPTQFLQYNLKLATNVLDSLRTGVKRARGMDVDYRGFTTAETARIMAAHLLMYGSAGFGGTMFVDEILGDQLSQKISGPIKDTIAQGALSGLFAVMTEALTGKASHVAIGSRLASFDFWTELGKATFSPADHSYLDAISGPTKQTFGRLSVVADVFALWKVDAYKTPEALLEGAKRLAKEEVSTWRNIDKAYVYYQNHGIMIDKQGTPIATLTNAEMLATALGFQPSQALDVYHMLADKKEVSKALDTVAGQIYRQQRQAILAANRGDMAEYEQCRKAISLLMPNNAGDIFEVQRRIKDNLFPYDTEFQKLVGEYMMKGQRLGGTIPFLVTSPGEK